MAGYVGIDESNHGRVPEIFVAVYSSNLSDIERINELPKRRNKKEIGDILEATDFKHIIISQEYRNLMTDQGMLLVAVSELVNGFSEQNYSIDMVFVDGQVKERTLNEIRKNIKPACNRILFEPNADKTFPVVNLADYIANGLHRHYAHFKNVYDNKKYWDKLITPDIKRYREQLDLLNGR
ncbi:MAG: hypothetical protein Q8O89_08025 [Nanoarchaeota archaeon]|nr:hypothetical protein [Nanoarchaeota archaeon]